MLADWQRIQEEALILTTVIGEKVEGWEYS